MLGLLLLNAPRGFRREGILAALLLVCMVAAITLELTFCVKARLAGEAMRLPDGSEVVSVDRQRAAVSRSGYATTRVKVADATLHGSSASRERIAFVDPAFLQVFEVSSCRGSIEHALARGDELVLTASAARRLFGAADPVGRSLVMSVGDEALALRVGAVACDPPAAARFGYSMLATLGPFLLGQSSEEDRKGDVLGDVPAYVRVPNMSGGRPPGGAAARGLLDGTGERSRYEATANSRPTGTARAAGRAAFLVVMLLCAAWSLARLSPRGREAAIYRSLDAARARLTAALLLDPILLVTCSGLLGVGATEWLFGGTLPYGGMNGVLMTLAMRCAAMLCALMPAPLAAAAGGRRLLRWIVRGRRVAIRVVGPAIAALAAAQIGIAIALSVQIGVFAPVIGFGGVGYEPANLLIVQSLADPAINAAQRQEILRSLAHLHGVGNAGATTRLFGPNLPRTTIAFEGRALVVPFAQADPGALIALRAQVLAGRPDAQGVVLTAATARRLGFASPAAAIGVVLSGVHGGPVRSVVRHMRFGPDGAGVSVGLFEVSPTVPSTAAALLRSVDLARATSEARAAWERSAPGVPFDAAPLRDIEQTAWSGVRDAMIQFGAALILVFAATLGGVWMTVDRNRVRNAAVRERHRKRTAAARVLVVVLGGFLALVLVHVASAGHI